MCVLPFSTYAQKLNVATYNIRYENHFDDAKGNGWKARCPIVTSMIYQYDFDLFGAQEVLFTQLKDLTDRLPRYGFVGVGRADGKEKGEFSPIFYKKDKYELVRSGTFWLSATDSIPSVGWDAALPRICSWGRFLVKGTNTTFWFFNLHNDHVGIVARLESSKLIIRKIQEMCSDEPVILTGDFNLDQTSVGYGYLVGSKVLSDTYEIAKNVYAPSGTFNDFSTNLTSQSRIDHIFVNALFKVVNYAILTDTYNATGQGSTPTSKTRLPSDHYPVQVELEFSNPIN
ncbi:MAG: endonuclease/exonuclease/phosphatase family protein [Bacteroidia bacterium]|nr:endonuclease/exonuclease/phosphatase family protein [Bacteroidia bacterium]